jgi:hypothetical protein
MLRSVQAYGLRQHTNISQYCSSLLNVLSLPSETGNNGDRPTCTHALSSDHVQNAEYLSPYNRHLGIDRTSEKQMFTTLAHTEHRYRGKRLDARCT